MKVATRVSHQGSANKQILIEVKRYPDPRQQIALKKYLN